MRGEALQKAIEAQLRWEAEGRPCASGTWPSVDCPACGYPRAGGYKGVYHPGSKCDGCGFLEPVC